jgi:hypothetical protein
VFSAVGEAVGSAVGVSLGADVAVGVAVRATTVTVNVGFSSGVAVAVVVGTAPAPIAAVTSAAPIRPSALKSTPVQPGSPPNVAPIAAATRSAVGRSTQSPCANAKLARPATASTTNAAKSQSTSGQNLRLRVVCPIARARPASSIGQFASIGCNGRGIG